jgi:histone-lysine N-methyltransferase SETMAR
MINSPKAMIAIFWSPLGFPLIQALPSKVTFTSEFFVSAVLTHIVASKPVGDPGRRLVLHMEDASPYRATLTARNLDENRITASPHPAFSPDLAPSDFFPFDALNGQLGGRIFESPDRLVEAIREIASTIPRTTLKRVFLEWQERLQQYVDINRACLD